MISSWATSSTAIGGRPVAVASATRWTRRTSNRVAVSRWRAQRALLAIVPTSRPATSRSMVVSMSSRDLIAIDRYGSVWKKS